MSRSLIDLTRLSFHSFFVLIRALFIFILGGFAHLPGESDDDLTLGIEAVTGMRTSYIYRGFQLSEASLEIQLASELALRENIFLGLTAWHITESGNSFTESAFGISLSREWELFQVTASLEYHAFENSLFKDGLDVGITANWFIDENWDLAAKGYYDFGAEGIYTAIELNWSQPISEKAYLSTQAGISAHENYYNRSGLNDFYGRLSLTYNVNSFLSLTPFAGYSLSLEEDASDEAYAGIWLAVSF